MERWTLGDADLTVSSQQPDTEIEAPALPYRPPVPSNPPPIGLIGCGAITPYHLDAYRDAGFVVAGFCDIDEATAKARRDAYNPKGAVYTDYQALLADPAIAVVDIATHVEIRSPIIEAALNAGKHVLSQKPFTLDLAEGERLADLADARGLKLAVNQNGRWAPHFSYMRNAIASGLIGDVQAAHLAVHWDHSWTESTVFNEMPHLILYDFAIHWFDMLHCFLRGHRPVRVYASTARTAAQTNKPPMLAQVAVEYEDAQATIVFDALTRYGALDTTYVTGTSGALHSSGADISHQTLTVYTAEGIARPRLEGEWFKQGFIGTMAELLCAIDADRAPFNSARENLESLSLCFAALASAETRAPQIPGTIRRMPR
ncbi:MAG: Gfo/Idh/MocA family oxidoreductase [Candidatus Hydrogenedentes bacterium]|nr:Gfo/Idh/MocA family oxidoreductase [Candidatus Hydrogenedentota bacterium]